ncbi:MAG: DUF924 family protein [Burkholderiales bacterium]
MSPVSFTDILEFWFGTPQSPERGRPRKTWFKKSPAFDAQVRGRFLAIWELAARGGFARWEATPLAALALVIVLDQFPRNMFRGDARSFAADPLALAAAKGMVASGFDRLLRPVERLFAYLPFEHAEDPAAQRRSLELFEALRVEPLGQDNTEYARRHFDIIVRFGRFPHRNAILGRESTPEELKFLQQPDSSF